MSSDKLINEDETKEKNRPLLKIENLKKWFPIRGSFLTSLLHGERFFIKAVDGVSFNLYEGEVLGLAGESGCGKTTVARSILLLTKPTDGRVYYEGQDITSLDKSSIKKLRRKMQMVFQDPYSSLSNRLTVNDLVSEPLRIHKLEMREEVFDVLEEVGLSPPKTYVRKYAYELSGGERQRVAIARSLILHPKQLIVDEPVSMIDVSSRIGILNLLLDLKRKYQISCLFITHDFAIARYVCDRIAIMYLGKIVEIGVAEEVIGQPKHPYTQALISVIPTPDPTKSRQKIILQGEVPSSINPPSGCRFHTRCPYAKYVCKKEVPEMKELEGGHYVACHQIN